MEDINYLHQKCSVLEEQNVDELISKRAWISKYTKASASLEELEAQSRKYPNCTKKRRAEDDELELLG